MMEAETENGNLENSKTLILYQFQAVATANHK